MLYLLIWIGVFVIGAGIILVQGASRQLAEGLPWPDVWQLWLRILPFLCLFLIHNFFVAPLLVHRRQTAAYVICVLLLVAAFAAFLLLTRQGPGPRPMPGGPGGPGGGFGPGGPMPRPMRGRPIPMNPAILRLVLAVLMLVANVGVKYQYRAVHNAARVKELEAENLQHRLDALRYQINPHFFMNTLNNIHALVDLDPGKAKESIVELSRMMRHILYDSGSPTIPLSQEIEFLQHYVALMRLRYSEGVDICLQLPEHDGGAQVPPLVYASFVENAFKHGVSYETPSFVHISVVVEGGRVVFRCTNSRQAPVRQDGGSGLGQENARRRLDLLYGDRYTMQVDQEAGTYTLILDLPVQPQTLSAV